MKGYKNQKADFSSYYDCAGKRLTIEELTEKLLTAHEHGPEIAALMNDVYRPESLHSNGDIDDSYIDIHEGARHNMARVTHETHIVSKADLEEQARKHGGLWDTLQESYTSYIKNTRRWKGGYQPEKITPDARFQRRVNETKLKMQKNRKFADKMRAKFEELFV